MTLVAVAALWGVPYPLIKVALEHAAAPLLVAGIQGAIGAAVLIAVAAGRGKLRGLYGHRGGAAGPFTLLRLGGQRVSSSLAAILVPTTPLFAGAPAAAGGFFIRVAVEHMPPSAVVFGRTLLGAAFLVPLAIKTGAFRGLRSSMPAVVMVTLLDMALPTFLTAWGEQRISSSLAGILTATDPLFTALLALWLIRSEAVNRRQLAGLVIGFAGVIALLGFDFGGHAGELSALRRYCSARSAMRPRHWSTGGGWQMPRHSARPRS